MFFFSCSFDVRDKMNSDQARHWSAPEVFGSRAKFHFDSQPATLEIKVSQTYKHIYIHMGYILHSYIPCMYEYVNEVYGFYLTEFRLYLKL